MSSDRAVWEYLEALKAFVNAADQLTEAWSNLDDPSGYGTEGYPEGLKSFDEFASELQGWLEAQAELHTPPDTVRRAALLGTWKARGK